MRHFSICLPQRQDALCNSTFLKLLSSSLRENRSLIVTSTIRNISCDELALLDSLLDDDLGETFLRKYIDEIKSEDYDLDCDNLVQKAECVKDFINNDNSSTLYGVLGQRNSKVIIKLLEILNSLSKDLEEDKTEDFYKLFMRLCEAKTPQGAYIFGSRSASDTTQKTNLGGLEAILDAKLNDPAKYERLMHLLGYRCLKMHTAKQEV